jgi:hypothetical protein
VVVLTAADLTAVVLMVAAISTLAGADVFPAVAAALVVAVLAAVAAPTPVVEDVAHAVAVDPTAVAALTAGAAGTMPTVILVAGCLLDPRRGAVARVTRLPLSIAGEVLLHPGHQEPAALPLATGSGTRLEAAGILLSRLRPAHRLPPGTASGTRSEAAGILLQQQRADRRARGGEAQREAGMARATKHLPIALDRPHPRTARRREGRQIAVYLDQVQDSLSTLQERRDRRFPGAAWFRI